MLSPKHELFVLAIARGETPREAYESVPGWRARGESARVSAERLLRKATVSARVAELVRAAARRNDLVTDRVLEEQRRIAFSDLRDYVTWGTPGQPMALKSPEEIGDAAAVAEITEEVTPGGTRRRIKMHDKVKALLFLSRYLGLDGEGLVTVEPLQERIRRLCEQREKASSRTVG